MFHVGEIPCAAYPSIFQSFNTAYFKVNMNSKWTPFTLTHIPYCARVIGARYAK